MSTIELWQALQSIIADYGQSDVSGHAPKPLNAWLANSFGHFAFGVIAAVWRLSFPVMAMLWGALVLKELLADLPGDAFAALTLADSALDVGLPLIGFRMAHRAIQRRSFDLDGDYVRPHYAGTE